jgi:Cu/Ag efflux pump CusA
VTAPVVALVFLPVLTMGGVQGKLFAPLGIAYILAIFASLAVALMVTSAFSAAILPHSAGEIETRFVQWLMRRHRRWLDPRSPPQTI